VVDADVEVAEPVGCVDDAGAGVVLVEGVDLRFRSAFVVAVPALDAEAVSGL
jgi:hypothetical protein